MGLRERILARYPDGYTLELESSQVQANDFTRRER